QRVDPPRVLPVDQLERVSVAGLRSGDDVSIGSLRTHRQSLRREGDRYALPGCHVRKYVENDGLGSRTGPFRAAFSRIPGHAVELPDLRTVDGDALGGQQRAFERLAAAVSAWAPARRDH